jgi:hypothetical protein
MVASGRSEGPEAESRQRRSGRLEGPADRATSRRSGGGPGAACPRDTSSRHLILVTTLVKVRRFPCGRRQTSRGVVRECTKHPLTTPRQPCPCPNATAHTEIVRENIQHLSIYTCGCKMRAIGGCWRSRHGPPNPSRHMYYCRSGPRRRCHPASRTSGN